MRFGMAGVDVAIVGGAPPARLLAAPRAVRFGGPAEAAAP